MLNVNLLAVPITGFVTLLIAAGLGVTITRSITEPLGRLVEGSKALARGEFQHQVSVSGQDELAQVGQVFNSTAGRLENLYENLRKSEANLAEAQRLSHTGSWDWDVASKRIFWSAEMFNIFGFDPKTTTPTPENYFQTYIRMTVPLSTPPQVSSTRETMHNTTTALFFQTIP